MKPFIIHRIGLCLLGCLGCLWMPGGGAAAALPDDAALSIPPENGYEALAIEGINEVALYNRYPASWTVLDLSEAWTTNALSKNQALKDQAQKAEAAAKQKATATDSKISELLGDAVAAPSPAKVRDQDPTPEEIKKLNFLLYHVVIQSGAKDLNIQG